MDIRIDEKGKYYTPRVTKDTLPALIRTTDQLIIGHIYIRPDKRLKDDLNEDHVRFLGVTDAQVYDADSETLLYQSSFLLVAYDHIVMLSPIETLMSVREVPWSTSAPPDQEELS